jgi:hypothetical protein
MFAMQSLVQRVSQSPRTVHAVIFWGATCWIVLVCALTGVELLSYQQDPDTYRHLYLHPERAVALLWVCGALYAVALLAQARRWHSQRTSSVAMASIALSFLMDGANVALGFTPACCGTSWSGPVLQLFL